MPSDQDMNDRDTDESSSGFAEWFHHINPRLVRFAAMSVDGHTAQDIAAESIFSVWQKCGETSSNFSSLTGLAFATCRGLVLNHIRSQRRLSRLFSALRNDPITLDHIIPDIAHDISESTHSNVRAYLMQLPRRERQTLALTIDGYTTGEIAGILDIDPAAVSSSLYRARRTLRTLLDERIPRDERF